MSTILCVLCVAISVLATVVFRCMKCPANYVFHKWVHRSSVGGMKFGGYNLWDYECDCCRSRAVKGDVHKAHSEVNWNWVHNRTKDIR